MDTRLKEKLSRYNNSTPFFNNNTAPSINITTPMFNDTTPLLNFTTSFFDKTQSTCDNNKLSFKKKNFSSRKKKHSSISTNPVLNSRKMFNDDQKVEAVVRIQLMGYTKAEVARGLNVAESTLRGWFKNEKIATRAEAMYKDLKINMSTGRSYNDNGGSQPNRPRDLPVTVEDVEKRRHKQLNPKKLQITSNYDDKNFRFYLPKLVQRKRYHQSLLKNRLMGIDVVANANIAKTEDTSLKFDPVQQHDKKKIVLNPPPFQVSSLADSYNILFQNFTSEYSKEKSKSLSNTFTEHTTTSFELQPLDLSIHSKNNYME